MEPQNILSNNVDIGRPELFDSVLRAIVINTQTIDTGQVVGQSVDPHVHNVVVVESLWNGNTPFKCRTRNGQIPEIVALETLQNEVSMLFWSNEIGVVLNMFDEFFVVGRHFEEIRFLLDLFERLSRSSIFVVGNFCIGVGDKRLFTNIVPTTVSVKIDVAVCSTLIPELLGCSFVTIRSCADIVIVRNENTLVEALETGNILNRTGGENGG